MNQTLAETEGSPARKIIATQVAGAQTIWLVGDEDVVLSTKSSKQSTVGDYVDVH